MKNRILLLVLVLLLSIFCSCRRVEEHTHDFSDKYSSDETSHWYGCDCGEKSEVAEHTFGNSVTVIYPTTESEGLKSTKCSVCGYDKKEAIPKLEQTHKHSFDNLVSNEECHWYECVCGETEGKNNHSWDSGEVTIPAGEVETGVKTLTCTECGEKVSENIPSAKESGLSFLRETHYRLSDKLSATPLTIEAVIRVDRSMSERVGAIFGNYYGIREDWLLEIHENGVPRFYYTDSAGNIQDIRFKNVDVRTGEYLHIALTFDFIEGAVSLYINGEIEQIIICDVDLADDITRYQFVIGGDNRSNNGNYFKGQISSVAVYSDVRTADEIARSAEKGTNLYADDLLAAYLLNENSGGKDIQDLSGNDYIIQKEWLDSRETTIDYAYSFAVVGDTQWLSKYKPEKFEGIYDWIVENKDSKKIAHVFGLGDITEEWNTAGKESEWIRAQQYIYKLNGVVPYSLVRGNHDESKYFNKYFATKEYMDQFGGYFMTEGDIRNSYKLVTIGTTDYLFLTIDFGASDEILAWANDVVIRYPDRRVIVTTHAYHGFDGGQLNFDNVPSSGNIHAGSDVDTNVGDNPGRGYNNGQQIWEKFISLHPNIFLVMSGHTPLEDVFVLRTEGVHGNVVNQMLIDPQWMDPQKDGTGMVCMLYFSEDGRQIEVEWICTDNGMYYKEQNQFVMDLEGSFDNPSHDFKSSYNEDLHYMACDCGYIHSKEAHSFDGGTLTQDGFMEYSCECGYKRVASATDDPIALELQKIIEKYYNGGVYYKSTSSATSFFNREIFWGEDDSNLGNTADFLTLYDILMGKRGDLRMDLGWNCFDGVYSSANESTVSGVTEFVLGAANGRINKVSIEENGAQLLIKLYEGDSVVTEATVGLYATTILLGQDGAELGRIYNKVDADGLCRIETPAFSGLVSEYDSIILSMNHDDLVKTVYYSPITVWDGKTVSSSLSGTGTETDPFLVQNGADLAYIARIVNSAAATTPNFSGKYFKMTQSIDLGGHDLFIGGFPGWASRKGFFGFFDGNHCTIRGLNSTASLFGTIETGSLKNLSVYGQVNGTSTIGGIVGYVASGGILENLTSYVTIKGTNTVGGIVGNSENQASSVINCVNYGSVTGTSWIIGGITGSGGHIISGCVNYGSVTTPDDVVGGIAGTTKDTGYITECYNYGTITARGKMGGIVGQAIKPVSNCVNYGDLNGTWALGGIVGYIKEGTVTISDCMNYGTITASSTGSGGILGLSEAAAKSVVKDCVNYGSLKTGWGCGGIVGDTHGDIIGCTNYGDLSAPGDLGGIVGKTHGSVTECKNLGSVTGTSVNVGGIVGRLHNSAYADVINSSNENLGSISAPDPQQIIGTVE